MVAINAITDAICTKIHAAFPTIVQYINLYPENFERPSFLIQYNKTKIQDVNATCVDVVQRFTVTCFLPVDELHETDTPEILNLQETLTGLFRKGYLRVDDRALRVTITNGRREGDKTSVTLQLEYFDDRGEQEVEQELIQEVSVRLIAPVEKEGG